MDFTGSFTNEIWLKQHIHVKETYSADSDDEDVACILQSNSTLPPHLRRHLCTHFPVKSTTEVSPADVPECQCQGFSPADLSTRTKQRDKQPERLQRRHLLVHRHRFETKNHSRKTAHTVLSKLSRPQDQAPQSNRKDTKLQTQAAATPTFSTNLESSPSPCHFSSHRMIATFT